MAATSEIEKLERRHAENPDGRFFAPLADAYRKAGHLDQALTVVRAGLEKHPEYLSAHIVLGRCLLATKDDDGASQAFQRVLSLDAENIIALKSLAEIAERKGDPAQACNWLQQLLKIDPMNVDADADLKRLGGAVGAAQTAPMEAVVVEEAPPAGVSFADVVPNLPPMPPTQRGAAPGEVTLVAAAVDGIEPTEFAPPAEEVPPPDAEMKPFDEGLAWGAGERSSRSISAEDVARALHEHDASVAAPSSEFEPAEGPSEHVVSEPLPMEEAWSADSAGAWAGGAESGAEPEEGLAPAAGAPEAEGWEAATAAQDEAAMFAAPETGPRPSLADLPIIMPDGAAAPGGRGVGAAKRAEPEPAAVDPLAGLPVVGAARTGGRAAARPPVEPEAPPLLTETMGDLYLRQGFRTEAAEVFRRLLAQRPDDAGLQAKLATAEGPPPRLGAAALGTESARSWLRRVAQARVGAEPLPPPPPPPEGPSPLEEAFDQPESPAAAEPGEGQPTRPAGDAFTLDSIFGSQGTAPVPPPSSPRPSTGASFDEFFGAAEQGTVRPDSGAAPDAPLDDDLSSFNSWLQGLKR